ncbi:hypothetical protein [Sivoneniella epilithica]
MVLLHYQTLMLLQRQKVGMTTRGGKREGAGGKPTWRYGKTKPVRVPVALAEKILEIARVLDEEGLESPVTNSKVIDLTGIAIYSSKDGAMVRLMDLLRAGYEIQPERLVRNLKVKPSLSSEINNLLKGQYE